MSRMLGALAALVFLCTLAHADRIGEQFISFAGFTLDEATALADVQMKYGPAKLKESGDGAGYEARICYATKTGLVRFRSDETGPHRLKGFSVSALRKHHECAAAQPELEALKLEIGGLKLGMSKEEFSSLVGPGVKWKNNEGRRFYEGEDQMTAEELSRIKARFPGIVERPYFDTIVSVVGIFKKDRLIEYQIWRFRTT